MAVELRVDVADLRALLRSWTDGDGAETTAVDVEDDVNPELAATLRSFLDPWNERVERELACRACGRWPGPHRFLIGWRPCRCGGHQTRFCRDDNGGCGHLEREPPLNPATCPDAAI